MRSRHNATNSPIILVGHLSEGNQPRKPQSLQPVFLFGNPCLIVGDAIIRVWLFLAGYSFIDSLQFLPTPAAPGIVILAILENGAVFPEIFFRLGAFTVRAWYLGVNDKPCRLCEQKVADMHFSTDQDVFVCGTAGMVVVDACCVAGEGL